MTIRGNGTVKTISINQRKGPLPKLPKVLVCYNLAEGLTDEEEDRFLITEEDLFAVGTITLPENLSGPLPDEPTCTGPIVAKPTLPQPT